MSVVSNALNSGKDSLISSADSTRAAATILANDVATNIKGGMAFLFGMLGYKGRNIHLTKAYSKTLNPPITDYKTILKRQQFLSIKNSKHFFESINHVLKISPSTNVAGLIQYCKTSYQYKLPTIQRQSFILSKAKYALLTAIRSRDRDFASLNSVSYVVPSYIDWANIHLSETYNTYDVMTGTWHDSQYSRGKLIAAYPTVDGKVRVETAENESPVTNNYTYITIPSHNKIFYIVQYYYSLAYYNGFPSSDRLREVYYDPASNTIPGLPLNPNLDTIDEEALPVFPVKKDEGYLSESSPLLFKNIKLAANKVSLDLDKIIEVLKTNPKQADVRDYFIHYAVNTKTKTEAGLEYLYKYFDFLHTGFASYGYADPSVNPDSITLVNIGYLEDNFNVHVQMSGLTLSKGLSGANLPTSAYSISFASQSLRNTDGESLSKTILRRKISISTYNELIIYGLKTFVVITAADTTQAVHTFDVNHPDGINIPLTNYILKQIKGVQNKDIILQESLRFMVYGDVQVALAWNETPEFIALQEAVIMGFSMYGLISMGLMGLIIIGGNKLLNFIEAKALEDTQNQSKKDAIRATAIGSKIALGVYAGGLSDSTSTAADTTTEEYATLTTQAITETTKEYNAKEQELLSTKIATQQRIQDYRDKSLAADRKILEDAKSNNWLFEFNKTNETPEAFFYRTLDSNPITNTLDSVSSYMDNVLTLPKIGIQ